MNKISVSEQTSIDNPTRPGQAVTRVGLFGGTFDPVHVGHLHMAEEIKAAFGLETIHVVPASVPPHKTWKRISASKDRLHMVRLCFGSKPGFDISDVELNRTGPSFTIDTIDHFLSRLNPPSELMMLVGSDSFFEIHTWRGYARIMETVALIVAMRPDHGKFGFTVNEMSAYLIGHVDSGYSWVEAEGCFQHSKHRPIYLFSGTPYDISSTDIRHRLKQGLDITSMVSKNVYDYIIEKGLYA